MRFWGYRDRPAEVVREGPTTADVDNAYAKGVKDERARHRSHPFLTVVVALVAVVGGAMLFLAAREGSFASGGQVMDAKIAQASAQAKVVGSRAANDARDQLHQDTAGR